MATADSPRSPAGRGGWIPGPMFVFQRGINRLLDDMLLSAAEPAAQAASAALATPRVDISETEQALEIKVDMPGVREADLQVTLDEDLLTIRGERRVEREEERKNQHLIERVQGVFQRTLQLPFRVDPDQVQATFEDGVLKLTVPKAQAAERAKRIRVSGPGQSSGEAAAKDQNDQKGQTDQSEQTGQPH